ncbi:MAG TPA: TonB family protein [Thermoanaerobaculia bacterium]|nr:TonB family protein [Thermoanaerobaculia bacterium]
MVLLQKQIEGKYEILEKIKEGGMGAVYKVRHRFLDEIRVIKVIRSTLEPSQDLSDRFLREARLANRLRHPSIAALHDFAVGDDGNAFIVMEYIAGLTLEDVLRTGGPPPLGLALEIATQALRAVGYLHRHGFVHRDIAPDNLMLTRSVDGDPLVKVIDLGIAKVLEGDGAFTTTGMFLGKPRYASPEHFGTEEIDRRSDLYSFGVVFYELLTGQCPVEGHDPASYMAGHLFRPPVDFDASDPHGTLPAELRAILLRALAKKPAERFAIAEEFSREIAALQMRFPVGTGDLDAVLEPTLEQAVTQVAPPPQKAGSSQVRLDLQFRPGTTPPPATRGVSHLQWDPRLATPEPRRQTIPSPPAPPALREAQPPSFQPPHPSSLPAQPRPGTMPELETSNQRQSLDDTLPLQSRARPVEPGKQFPQASSALPPARLERLPPASSARLQKAPAVPAIPAPGAPAGQVPHAASGLAPRSPADPLRPAASGPMPRTPSDPGNDPPASGPVRPQISVPGDADWKSRPLQDSARTQGALDGAGGAAALSFRQPAGAAKTSSGHGLAARSAEPGERGAWIQVTVAAVLLAGALGGGIWWYVHPRSMAQTSDAMGPARPTSSSALASGGGAAPPAARPEQNPGGQGASNAAAGAGLAAAANGAAAGAIVPAAAGAAVPAAAGVAAPGAAGVGSPAAAAAVAPVARTAGPRGTAAGQTRRGPETAGGPARDAAGTAAGPEEKSGGNAGRRGAAAGEPLPAPERPDQAAGAAAGGSALSSAAGGSAGPAEAAGVPAAGRRSAAKLIVPGPGVELAEPQAVADAVYPAAAIGTGKEPRVLVAVLVDENGNVADARVKAGDPSRLGFNEAAVAAARKSRFLPATKDGVPGRSWSELMIEFTSPKN